MKRISTTIFLTSMLLFTLNGCTYNCACEDAQPEDTTAQVARPIPTGEQLISECKYIDDDIADSKLFAEKMAKSRYAMQYLAMSREKISGLQARAKEIGCQ